MNAKQLFAAASLAVIGTAALAEPTTFALENGTLTRAEVKAELVRAQGAGELSRVAVYGSFPAAQAVDRNADKAAQLVRSRDEVRAEARAAGRSAAFDTLYVGG